MACSGCSRNRKNSGTRKKIKTIREVSPPKMSLTIAVNDLLDRKKKCSGCPFNARPGLTGRCKKSNRLVNKAINDASFKCPIKRF